MIKIWDKLWEWVYRETHKIEWIENKCIKIPKQIKELDFSPRKMLIHSIITKIAPKFKNITKVLGLTVS